MANGKLNGKRVAILATDGVEQVELTEPRKALDAAGATTTLVSLKSGTIKAWQHDHWGDELKVDATLDSLSQRIEGEGVDILVLCAGEYAHGPIAEAPVEDFDRLYASNLRMNYRLIQALLPTLKRRRGQIAIINSSTGLTARADAGQFAATQHALKAIADAVIPTTSAGRRP